MDYFSVFFNSFCLIIQSIIQLIFTSQFSENRYRTWHFILYSFLLFTLGFIANKNVIIETMAINLQLIILYELNCIALGTQRSISLISSILAIYILQLSFGIINSIEAIVFPNFIGKPLLYLFLILATITAFIICICCYLAVLKFLSLRKIEQMPFLLLFPVLFFFIAELYILHMSYSSLPSIISLTEKGKHIGLLLMQILGLVSLLCTLYAYQRICYGFQTQSALISLKQAAQAQKTYIYQAKMRYEQTKTFRHDIKNHLSVLNGLLNNGELQESINYLKKLEATSNSLFFPYQTGNPVVDILLGEKLELAKSNKIDVEVSLILPKSCYIDDFDLCVIFANALDNAVKACQSIEGAKSIYISGKQQGDFYMLEFHNTCSINTLPKIGIGLSNIKAVAEKYHGTMLIEKDNQHFCLNVLLNISLHSDNNSKQSY